MTMTFLIVYQYIFKFYRLLKANEQFRITVLARYMAAMSRGERQSESIFDVVYRLKRRVRVLLYMVLINMFCWYPLFILTLSDHKYRRARYYYRILTVIAWSHSALIPLPLLLMDRSFGIWCQVKQAVKMYKSSKASSPSPNRHLLANHSKDSSLSPTPNLGKRRDAVIAANCINHSGTNLTTSCATTNMETVKIEYGSVRNSPRTLRCNDLNSIENRSGMYDRLNAELHPVGATIPSPISPGDTVESRVNQSRETDLLYEYDYNGTIP